MKIENDILSASFRQPGAELTTVVLKTTGTNYLWEAGAEWPKYAPVLFPIVGALKGGKYRHNGKEYSLPRHGFAREKEFTILRQEPTAINFRLEADESSRVHFPFDFRFDIQYELIEATLAVNYKVFNSGNSNMFFSVGAHPAFKIPLDSSLNYEDYYIEFKKPENAPRWPIAAGGQLSLTPRPFLQNQRKLPLTKDLFLEDALVFKNLQSTSLCLLSERSPHGIEFEFSGFPYMGIWAAPNADFVCIEPWCGIADSEAGGTEIAVKEGIERLEPGQEFNRRWTVKLF